MDYLTKEAGHLQIRVGADPGTGGLLGTVTGDGLVKNATVTINRGFITETTDAGGNFNFGNTVAGEWEVTVTADGYLPQVKTVVVEDSLATTTNFTLTTDP